MAIVTDTVAVQRFAMGLFGVQVGTVTMGQVDKQIDRTSLNATLNSYYASAFGTQTTAAVAATLVANLGITGAGVANAVTYVTAKLNAAAPAARGEEIANIINMFSGLTGDAVYGAAAQTWNANVDAASAYTGAANVAFGAVISQSLTGGLDTLFGSALADMFNADADALQNGDNISGGAGNDTLKALLTTGNAVTATTSSVEKVIITSQNGTKPTTGDNNVANADVTTVDAARMSGVNQWENSNSRADLIVEDVRIADNQITKDITITMRETDPGNVDFAVYFDQNSLRSSSASKSQVFLEVMDTRAAVKKLDPLLNSPYTGFAFTVTDSAKVSTVVELKSDAINAAQTYADLAKAFQAAADAKFGAGTVTVSVGANFTVRDTEFGESVIGQKIVMTTNGSFTFSTPAATSGWLAAGVSPANSGLHTNFTDTAPTTNTDPVTSTIVLDDVGRGSTGGDLVIGGLSVGETSSSKGVQRFNITVEDNSKLQTVNSTSNTLREVSIVNGTTSRVNNAYNDNVKDAGNLTVTGKAGTYLTQAAAQGNGDNQLPGLNDAEHGAYGFTDVKLIDASTFKGKLDLNAQLTDRVVAKYMTLTDAQPAAAADDNVSFDYLMGTNNDTFALNISSANLSTKGTTTREDFVLNIAGNAGDDKITAKIGEASANWYGNSAKDANLNINGGTGNDTITTELAGDWKIVGGEGNDVVYDNVNGLDNTSWVFNGTGSLNNIASGKNDKNFFADASVSVTFKHITATVKIASSTDGFTTDLQINQAIKEAINKDDTLKALLVAKDGPANSLVVTSLIDGAATTDLNLAFARTTEVGQQEANTYGAAYNAAYNAMGINPSSIVVPTAGVYDKVQVTAVMNAHLAALTDSVLNVAGGIYAKTEKGDYKAAANAFGEATSPAVDNQGDSTFTLGTGNDILVLDTNLQSSDKVVYTKGEAFGADTVLNFGVISAFEAAAAAAGTAVNDATAAAATADTAVNNAQTAVGTAIPADKPAAEAALAAANAAKVAADAAKVAADAAKVAADAAVTTKAGLDKFDFTGLGGDVMSSATLNYTGANDGTNGIFNFVKAASAQALLDAGIGYNAGNFLTQTTGANEAGKATYFATPTAGKNKDSLALTSAQAAAAKEDKSIVIVDLDQIIDTNGYTNDTAAEVALYVEGGSTDIAKSSTHVVVVVDKHNVGSVYAVVDGTADKDAVATLMGTIDLGDTQWSSLTADNFV